MNEPSDPTPPGVAGSAPRRTILAAERTQLAWWRTAFAVLAVGLAIAKIVPQLAGDQVIWPFTVLGALYALYAVGLMIHGSRRRERVELAVESGAGFGTPAPIQSLITGGAIFLAVATSALIIFS
ncbi:MAG: DUF202 domain-containing protein [Thermoleophilia bacterium]|nr:DUF202 domain-containing protein [Thermoleophilia bacterium]